MKIILFIISFFWQLPQNIIAIYLFLKNAIKNEIKKVTFSKNVIWIELWRTSDIPGLSLGNFILIREDGIENDPFIKAHEFGHVKQSWVTGWLYLIIIGIPSYYNHIKSGIDENFREIYYTVYPEKWADKWGNVTRGKK
jgi:hypothetical protein